ncbi:DUF4153 domain-containing protein [Paraburkholderia humisilvae]|uniref:DUF4153 domain-containing protein n=1 Tax=Paraburkholderia humisilvae TaxID=627669 RepID=A0A6J5F7T7_9BURK|nr:DUF4153 domain-containing protein [Paraburkholderia humisilvae]CAB3773206.1 hypothetical protein LMG29542_07147 [Paraburkholderia humisilvae]
MQSNQQGTPRVASESTLVASRMVVGLCQGLALYVLVSAMHDRSGIAKIPVLFFPLILVALFVPPTIVVGLSQMRAARLLMWATVLAVGVAVLGYHVAWRLAGTGSADMSPVRNDAAFPSVAAVFHTGLIVFIAFCLVLAGEAERSWFARYESYFEVSWKLGLQVCLSAMFVCAVFLVLWLGAELFLLVKLHFLEQLLRRSWFNLPIGAVSFAWALQITDVRPDISQGARTLVLSLMSWLLPVLVVIAGGFLASLPFTGLGLLWSTRIATWIMLSFAALKILFVNAVFKGGARSDQMSGILRVCTRVLCLLLPVLVILGTYALALRIGQYGLTPRRVLACAATSVICVYAIGYAWAALACTDMFARIAPVNVVTAWIALAVLVALLTPLADPARLSVTSQVARLLAGSVSPGRFDYNFLRYGSARYGLQALARLQGEIEGPNAAAIRELSIQAAHRAGPGLSSAARPNVATLASNIVSRSPGRPVPASFLSEDWKQVTQRWDLPGCLTGASVQCEAYLVDLTGNHKANVVLFPNGEGAGFIFDEVRDGDWQLVGRFSVAPNCAAVRDALAKGNFQLVEPRLHDIRVNGERIEVQAMPAQDAPCVR